MFTTFTIFVLAFAAQDNSPGTLVPIEQGMVDRSASATTLRVQPVELSETTNFQKLFGVAGRPDLFVRSQGGLYAVFDQGSYKTVQGRTMVLWPAGTIYYIGQPNFSVLKSSGVRMNQSVVNLPPGIEPQKTYNSGVDKRIGATPENNLISATPIGERAANEPINHKTKARVPAKDAGYGLSSAVAGTSQSTQSQASDTTVKPAPAKKSDTVDSATPASSAGAPPQNQSAPKAAPPSPVKP